HPLIHQKLQDQLKKKGLIASDSTWFYEASLLFETGAFQKFRQVWVTYCPEQEQLRRLAKRERYDLDFAKKIIASQMSALEKAERADVVINTDSPITELRPKVRSV